MKIQYTSSRIIVATGVILALLIPNTAALGDPVAEPKLDAPPVISVLEESPAQSETAVIAVNPPEATQDSSVMAKETAPQQDGSSLVKDAAPETKSLTIALPTPKKKVKTASPKKVVKTSTAKSAEQKHAKKQANPVTAKHAESKTTQEVESGNIFSRTIEAAKNMVRHALTWLGTRYIWGGTSRQGIDCSGLTRELYAKLGIKLPHSAQKQSKLGQRVAGNALKPGDLVFFNTNRGPCTHVGIYIGDGKFLHAANPKRGVRIDSLSSSYYSKRLAAARRYS